MNEVIMINVSDIVFNKTYYTRFESQSPNKVKEYATSIQNGTFPPILITESNILLDGWHRWMATKECGMEKIESKILDTSLFKTENGDPDLHTIRRKAAYTNCRHGHPQTAKELKKLIRDDYKSYRQGFKI